jgi:hypothetical protein
VTARANTSRRRGVGATLALIAAITATALVATPASAKDDSGGKGTQVGCPLATNKGTVYADPGETFRNETVTKDQRGRVTSHSAKTYICGEDGEWHLVANLVLPPTFTVTTVRYVTTASGVAR